MYLGIRRRVDDLGRIVIPKEIRQSLGIETEDLIDITCINGEIILKKIDTVPLEVKNFLNNIFNESTTLHIINNYRIVFSNNESEIGKYENNIKALGYQYCENVSDTVKIIVNSANTIDDYVIKICKILPYLIKI